MNQARPFFLRLHWKLPGLLGAAIVFFMAVVAAMNSRGQSTNTLTTLQPKRVLLVFSEARDLAGNVLMEQAVRREMQRQSTNLFEFYTESMDASRFPNDRHYHQFGDYLKNRYLGQKIDLLIAFMVRDYRLADELPAAVFSNVPSIFVAVSDQPVPVNLNVHPVTGVVQRLDLSGTFKFILQLQPETRRVVVVGGTSKTDQEVLKEISDAAESVDGVKFEFWTNRPITEIRAEVGLLPSDTVVLLSPTQRDVTGELFNTPQVARTLAPVASVPLYVLGSGQIGTGALGGSVVNAENLGTLAGQMALQTFGRSPPPTIPITLLTNGTPMVDWRALQRWNIKSDRLPAHCIVHYNPRSIWREHPALITFTIAVLVAQAITIAGLLVQRRHRYRAEAEIQRQRTELAHVARISTMGQLAAALTHELNQPLGAILRNAEAAEIFLQSEHPNLNEIRAILADIRRDDRRAGNVIDRMRTLYKRRSPILDRLDLRELVEDTVALARPDAEKREVKLAVQIASRLPAARGDRVHLQQVLLNLILNAMDAAGSASKARRLVSVRVGETDDGKLQVTVTDRGGGISPDDAARIFEPFFTTKPDGMGMGLAISRTIIEAHGGDIWMESNALKGTLFAFTIPHAENSGDLPPPV